MEIEKNIPLPKTQIQILSEMEVGDSSLFANANSARQISTRYAAECKKNGIEKRFTARKVDGGVRVWRIA